MSSKPCFNEVVEQISAEDTRYGAEVYHFVREGLEFTLKSLKRHQQGMNRHVSGQELLGGLRDFALREYGPMTKSVLAEWGVRSCEDFGQVVFNLVNKGVLGKNEADSPNDFKNGFDFEEAFVKPFAPQRPVRRRSPRAAKRQSGSRTRGAKPLGAPQPGRTGASPANTSGSTAQNSSS